MSARSWIPTFAVSLAVLLGLSPSAAQESGSLVMWGQRALPDPAEVHDIIAVAAGERASLALRTDGRILAWGDGPMVVIPEPNAGFTGLWASDSSALGLRDDGSLCAWGFPSTISIPEPNNGFVKASMGPYHSLGLKSDGSIVAWGDNSVGECDVPQPNADWVDVAAGVYISMGLKSDGSIMVWGDNRLDSLAIPQPNDDFVGISSGGLYQFVPQHYEYLDRRYMIGVKSDGRLVVWGTYEFSVPEPNSGFNRVSTYRWNTVGIREDGSLVLWYNPNAITILVSDPGVAYRDGALCANYGIWLRADGSVEFWGYNDFGQCGLREPNQGFVDVESFLDNQTDMLVAQREDGTLLSQGSIPPDSDLVVTTFALSAGHGLGVTPAGQVVSWGSDALPPPPPNESFVSVATGNYTVWSYAFPHNWGYWDAIHHDIALREDGSLVAWGDNRYGQCDIPSPNADFVAVDAATTFGVALDVAGFVHCWGTLPELYANGGIVAIDAGPDFCLALRADGSVVAWGDNSLGQCLVPEPNEGFVAISAGQGAGLGIKADGSIVSWGAYAVEPPAPNEGFLDAEMWDGRCFGIRRSELPVIPSEIPVVPGGLTIRTGFPNPFNPMIQLEYELQQPAHVTLAVFNLAGQQVLRRGLGDQASGSHLTQWNGRGQDGRNLASGTYFIRLADDQGRGAVIPCLLQR